MDDKRSSFCGRRSLANPRRSSTANSVKKSRLSKHSLASTSKMMPTPAPLKKPDPRKLNEKSKRHAACSCLLKFLIYLNYKGGSLKKQELFNISTRLFQETFDFLAKRIDPNWKVRQSSKESKNGAKPEECMLNFLRQLEYPFEITKSKLKDAVPANYPQLTGVLCWLAELVKYVEHSEAVVDGIIENSSDELKQVKQDYFRECYEEFMDNKDEPFEQVEMRVEKRLESLRQNVKEEVKSMMSENKHLNSNMKVLKQEEAKFQRLSNEVEQLKDKWTKTQKYFEDMNLFLPKSRENVKEKETECKKLQAKIETQKKKLAQLKSDVCCQQYSKKDMEKFKQQLISHKENKEEIQQRLHTLQEAQKKELPKILKAESVYERLKVDCDENLQNLFSNSSGIISDENHQNHQQFLMQTSDLSIEQLKQMLLKHASKFVDNVHFELEDEHKKVKKNLKHEENRLSQETYKCERLSKDLITCQQERNVQENIEKQQQQERGRIDDETNDTSNNYKSRGNMCNIGDLKLQLQQLQTKCDKREKERKLEEIENSNKLKTKFESLVKGFNKEFAEMERAEKECEEYSKNFCDEKKREIAEVERKSSEVDVMVAEVMKNEEESDYTLEGMDDQIKLAKELVEKLESM